MQHLVALISSPRTIEGPERLAGLDTPSDRSMILLQIIIQIGTGSTAAATTQLPLLLQFRHHLRIGGVAVNDGHARAGMSGILQGSLEKAPAAGASRVAESQKSMVAPMESITRVGPLLGRAEA
jgi:hypothetical protein